MRTHFKFQIILTVTLFFAIEFNANAQNGYSFDHQFKSGFNHDELDKPAIERPHIFDDAVPQKFVKSNFTEDLLDSVEYSLSSINYKEFNSYDMNRKISNIIKQDNSTGQWTDRERTTFFYDNMGRLINWLHEIKVSAGNTYQKKESYSYTYNNEGKKILELHEKWNFGIGDSLEMVKKYYSYDQTGNIIEVLQQVWQNNDSSWNNIEKDLFTYRNDGKRLKWTNEIWISSISQWIGMYNHTYSYDTGGKVVSLKKDKWSYEDSVWINFNRFNYSYNNNGDISIELVEKFENDTWKNMRLHTYTYDNSNNLIEYLWQYWLDNNSIWSNAELMNYSYDSNRNLISESFKVWEGIWKSHFTKLYSYNTNGSLKNFSYIDELGRGPFNGFISIFNNLMEFKYTCEELTAYYSPLTNINDSENLLNSFSLSQNYPNPFNPTTKINFTIPTSPLNPSPYQGEGQRERLVTLKVYDILGNKITTLINEQRPPGTYEIEFNAQNLPSGVYFYQITAGNFNQVKKMLLLK